MRAIRKRFFVACEGNGERAFVTALQQIANELSCPIHLDTFNAHGGAPLDILRRSVKEHKLRSNNRGNYDGGSFLLLDQDRIDREECQRQILAEATAARIKLVRQQARLEGHLGRILSGRYTLGAIRAEEELRRAWPLYERSFDAATLRSKIDAELVRSSYAISEEWAVFLTAIGIKPG